MRKKPCAEKLEKKIKRIVSENIPPKYQVWEKQEISPCRWEVDLLVGFGSSPKIVIECKDSETEHPPSSFESAMGKAYMMLNDLRLGIPPPQVHYFVVVNRDDKKRDYQRLFKKIRVGFVNISMPEDRREFVKTIKRICK